MSGKKTAFQKLNSIFLTLWFVCHSNSLVVITCNIPKTINMLEKRFRYAVMNFRLKFPSRFSYIQFWHLRAFFPTSLYLLQSRWKFRFLQCHKFNLAPFIHKNKLWEKSAVRHLFQCSTNFANTKISFVISSYALYHIAFGISFAWR